MEKLIADKKHAIMFIKKIPLKSGVATGGWMYSTFWYLLQQQLYTQKKNQHKLL